MTKTSSLSCPACGEALTFGRRDDVLTVRGQERSLRSLGWWCDACDEGILDGAALVEREKAHLEPE